MPPVVFRCRRCRAALSPPLERLTDPARLDLQDGAAFVPPGLYWEDPGPEGEGGWNTDTAGQFFVAPGELLGTRLHMAQGRLNGCCGLDGCDGPNRLCDNCGAEVATERSDCWMPHSAAFRPDAVLPEPVPRDA